MPLSEPKRRKCVETRSTPRRRKKAGGAALVTYPHISIEDSYAISTAVAQHKIKVVRSSSAQGRAHLQAMQASSQIKRARPTGICSTT